MSNSLKTPVVVDKLPTPSGKRGPKSTYIDGDALLLAVGNKNQWVHCYSFHSEDSSERRKKSAAMRSSGNNFVTKNNENQHFHYWQYKVITVEDTVNLYIICESREGTDWQ